MRTIKSYLDNAASTCVHPEVVETMLPFFQEHYGNPSSRHVAGSFARDAVDASRETIATIINSKPGEIVFTSGGTEADHLALVGASLLAPPDRRHVIVSAIEHQAVLRAVDQLEQSGFSVTVVEPDAYGIIQTSAVADALRPDTFLVSIMLVNNEIGTIQPLEEISAILKPRKILFHTDAVQGFGKIPIDVKKLGVDLMSLSAHKLHGPKGVGALYIRNGVSLKPLIPGGGQEHGLRSGTENVPAIAGFGKASEIAENALESVTGKVLRLRDKLESTILSEIAGSKLSTSTVCRSPYISNILFPMINNDYLMTKLYAAGVCVTSGSACSSHSQEPSHVLRAIKLPENLARCAIRFSLSALTTEDEIEYALQTIRTIVKPFAEHLVQQ